MFTQQELDTMLLQSFRYCLGRRTYAVSNFCDMFARNFGGISKASKFHILKELKEEFERDNMMREYYDKRNELPCALPLGDNCDRKDWQRVLDLLEAWEISVDNSGLEA